MEAKVRFTGAVDEVAGAVVEAVEEEAGGEPAGVLQAKLDEAVEPDLSLENADVLEIGAGEESSDVFFVGGEEGLVETILEDTGAGGEGFDLSNGGEEEPISLEVV